MRTFPLPQIIPSDRFTYTADMGNDVLPNFVEAINSGDKTAIRLCRMYILPFIREAIRTYKDCAAPGRNAEWSVLYGAHWDTRTNRLVISTYCD